MAETKPMEEKNVAKEVPSDLPEPTEERSPLPEKEKEAMAKKTQKKSPEPAVAPAAATTSSGKYALQVGTFSEKENAVKLIQKLTQRGYEAYGAPLSGQGKYHTVFAGPFYSKLEAEEAAGDLKRSGMVSARVTYDKRDASYRVDVGKYASSGKSESMMEKIRRLGFEEGSELQQGGDSMTVVFIGNFASEEEAKETQGKLPEEDVPSSFIIKAPNRG